MPYILTHKAAYIIFLALTASLQLASMSSIPIVGQLYTYLKNNKAPLNIVGVNGLMPHNYAIVYTTIHIKPNDYTHASKLGPSPLITRTQIGSLGPTNSAVQFQAQLDVPNTPIDLLSSTHNIPKLVTSIAGAINPIAGTFSKAISAVLDIGLQIASDQINTTLCIQDTTMGLLEIIPTQYYRINNDTHEIEITTNFKEDIASYDTLHAKAIPATQVFNNANKKYEFQRLMYYKKYGTYELIDQDQQAEADYNAILEQYNSQLIPALKTAVGFLKQLERYNLHRIAIMALNTKPNNNNPDGWRGPFKLNIFFFLGAKTTNIFNVDFYVKDATNIQNIMIKISPDILGTNPLHWNKGGIKLIAVDKNNQPSNKTSQIGFQSMRAGTQYMASESVLYSFWDSMIISGEENSKGLTQYLLPFDINKLEQEVHEKNKAQSSAALKTAETAIGTLKMLFDKKDTTEQLLNPTSSGVSTTTGLNPNDIPDL